MTAIRPRLALGAAAFGIALSVAGPALAVDAKGNYSVRGVGSQLCETVVANVDKEQAAGIAFASWILGYMSASNRFERETFDLVALTDANSVVSIALSLCRKHPKVRVESVVTDMLRAFAPSRVKAESPLVEMKSGDKTAAVRQETLLLVQQGLSQRGLLKARPDGSYGPQTEAALKQYQTNEKLPVTGVADSATLVRMLVEQAPRPAPAAAPAPTPAPPARTAPARPAQPTR